MKEARESIRPAWGAIDQLPSGNWRLRGRIEGERTTIGTFDTLDEALGAAKTMAAKVADAPSGLTVNGWICRWLDDREKAWAKSGGRIHRSVGDSRSVFRCYVEHSPLGGMLVREVKTKHVAQWIHHIEHTRDVARSTVANARNLVRTAFRDAAIAGHCDGNPALGVVLRPRDARTEEEWTFLSAAEIAQLLGHDALESSVQGRYSRNAFAVAIYTGLREGEICGLQWPDVHLNNDDPHIVVRYGNSAGKPTKSGRPRIVPLLQPARLVLAAMRDNGQAVRIGGHVFAGRKGPHGEGYDAGWAGSWHRPRKKPRKGDPSLGSNGKPARVWRDGWRERCGISRDVTFHDLRHTYASHLVMGTWGRAWRIEEIQRLLGHVSITTTQRYAHLAPDALHASAAEADEVWRMAPPARVTSRVTSLEEARLQKKAKSS